MKGSQQYNIHGTHKNLRDATQSLKRLNIDCTFISNESRIFITIYNSSQFINMQTVCNAYDLYYEYA